MDNKLQKLKNLKTIKLDDEERNLLRAHTARIVMSTPVIVTDSFFKRGVQHGLRIALSSALFTGFIVASVFAAANNALPGDALYPFKINVNEEVKGLFLKTPEEKVLWQQNRVENRVNEIQTLANTNSLTPENQQTAEAALNNNVADLSTDLTTLSQQSPSAALSVTASLEQTLKANKVQLQNTPDTNTVDNAGKTGAIQSVNAALQQVSNQEVRIISTEVNSLNAAANTVQTNTASAPLDASTTATVGTTESPDTTSLNPVTPATP